MKIRKQIITWSYRFFMREQSRLLLHAHHGDDCGERTWIGI